VETAAGDRQKALNLVIIDVGTVRKHKDGDLKWQKNGRMKLAGQAQVQAHK